MQVRTVDAGFYWIDGTAAGDSRVDTWDAVEEVATLDWAPRDRQAGNCLALSGGGYRAALFHLGVLRRLNELGMLGSIDTIACVSGGSIIGAMLAKTIRSEPEWWPKPGAAIASDVWEGHFAEPVREALRKDIRTSAVFSSVLSLRLNPAVAELEAQLGSWLEDLRLRDLPARPNFLFCASELSRGGYWVFSRHRIGPYKGPFALVLPDYPVARAVAASACFPPVFTPQRTNFLEYLEEARSSAPVTVDVIPGVVEDPSSYPDPRNAPPPAWQSYAITSLAQNMTKHLQRVMLTDGGVFDNNGIEAVWAHANSLVVSDAGGPFALELKRKPQWILSRYSSMQTHFGRESQLRWLKSLPQPELPNVVVTTKDFDRDPPAPREETHRYPKDLRRLIASVRTDLNVFDRDEIEILENFGYTEAAHQLRRIGHAVAMPNADAAVSIPWPQWMEFDDAHETLRDAHKRLQLKKTLSAVPKALAHVMKRVFDR